MRFITFRHTAIAAAAIAGLIGPSAALGQALPFFAPGDSRLRHMIELDSDSGQIALTTTWPVPSFDVPADERDALRAYNEPSSASDAGWFISGAVKPTRLRTFSDTPRESGEAGLQSGWAAGDYAGGATRLSYAFNPQDGMHYRFDGTYVAWRIGNWWLTVGSQDRWWGPGWDGSLILSSNARPMPGVGVERASSLPPEWKLFRWIGPWRFTTILDHMENHRADFNNTLFWGARLTFAPVHGLELGVSRTAEFCGQGHTCGLSTFLDMLTARSNRQINPVVDTNPSEAALLAQKQSAQVIATDVRWQIPHSGLAFYWQQLGEVFDDHNYRPRQTLQLLGIEFASWHLAEGRLRTFLEFADTTCGDVSFSATDKPNYGCGYEKDTWKAGYRYRGRVIGDSMDRDGRRFTIGLIYGDPGGLSWDVRVRHFDLNRGGIAQAGLVPQTVTRTAEKLWNSEFEIHGRIGPFYSGAGIGADYGGPPGAPASTAGRVFVNLSRPW